MSGQPKYNRLEDEQTWPSACRNRSNLFMRETRRLPPMTRRINSPTPGCSSLKAAQDRNKFDRGDCVSPRKKPPRLSASNLAGGFEAADCPSQIVAGFLSLRIRFGVRLQVFFHPLPFALCPFDINVFRALSNLRQNDDAIGKNFGEAPVDRHVMLASILAVLKRTRLKFSEEGCVAGKHTQKAFPPGDRHLIHFLFGNFAVRSNNLQMNICSQGLHRASRPCRKPARGYHRVCLPRFL